MAYSRLHCWLCPAARIWPGSDSAHRGALQVLLDQLMCRERCSSRKPPGTVSELLFAGPPAWPASGVVAAAQPLCCHSAAAPARALRKLLHSLSKAVHVHFACNEACCLCGRGHQHPARQLLHAIGCSASPVELCAALGRAAALRHGRSHSLARLGELVPHVCMCEAGQQH